MYVDVPIWRCLKQQPRVLCICLHHQSWLFSVHRMRLSGKQDDNRCFKSIYDVLLWQLPADSYLKVWCSHDVRARRLGIMKMLGRKPLRLSIIHFDFLLTKPSPTVTSSPISRPFQTFSFSWRPCSVVKRRLIVHHGHCQFSLQPSSVQASPF
jgi:hypothetical protein